MPNDEPTALQQTAPLAGVAEIAALMALAITVGLSPDQVLACAQPLEKEASARYTLIMETVIKRLAECVPDQTKGRVIPRGRSGDGLIAKDKQRQQCPERHPITTEKTAQAKAEPKAHWLGSLTNA